jgi:hypothetical protein
VTRRRCAYTTHGDDGTRGRCPRMARFEVLDDGIWEPRCDGHREHDPGAEARAVVKAGPRATTMRRP